MTSLLKHLNKILTRQFNKEQAAIVINDIQKRMLSLLQHWDNTTLRNELLLPAIEVATFYRPKCDLTTTAFVVTTIRNSLLEDIYSTTPCHSLLKHPKIEDPDQKIKKFMQSALEYLVQHGLDKIRNSVPSLSDDTIYKPLTIKYPLASAAFRALGNSDTSECEFDTTIQPTETIDFKGYLKPDRIKNYVTLSGIDPDLDPEVMNRLYLVMIKEFPCFHADSFKMITRNIEKLYRIVDFVLSQNAAFVTFNYYIECGYASRRNPLLKPSHSDADYRRKLTQLGNVSPKHQNALQMLSD